MAKKKKLADFSSPDAWKAWAKMIAKAWLDPEFKARLTADPAGVLKENGIDVPDDIDLRIAEGYRPQYTLWLPPKPEGVEESDLSGHAKNVSFIAQDSRAITYMITYMSKQSGSGHHHHHCRHHHTREDLNRQCGEPTRPDEVSGESSEGSDKKKSG